MNDPWGQCMGSGVVGTCAKGDHDHCTGGVHVAYKRYVRCSCPCHARTGVQPVVNGLYGIGEQIVGAGAAFAQATSELGPFDTSTQPNGETW